MEKSLQLFQSEIFETHPIRILGTYTKPWFVAKDITNILGYSNTQQTIRTNVLETDRKTVQELGVLLDSTLQLQPHTTLINESGLYSLILRSNKPKAAQFQRWVTSEVLPSLRQSGEYKMEQKIKDLEEKHSQELDEVQCEKDRLYATYQCYMKRRQNIQKQEKGASVYVIGFDEIPDLYKIGCTKNLNKRMQDFWTENPYEPKIYYHRLFTHSEVTEKIIHAILRNYRIHDGKEWFKTTDPNVFCQTIDSILDVLTAEEEKHAKVKSVKPELQPVKGKTKRCPKCRSVKSLVDDFYKSSSKGHGVDSYCKMCKKSAYAQRKNKTKLQISKKKCTLCGKVLPVSNFNKRQSSADGKTSECKKCCITRLNKRVENLQDNYECLTEKTCIHCNVTKSIENFCPKKDSRDGHLSVCKPCHNIRTNKNGSKVASPDSKTCTTCHNHQLIKEFYRKKQNRDGYDNKCRSCWLEYRKNKKKF